MKDRKGMTLIEVIISIMLLSMISIAILPISAYSMKYAKWNNIKLNALNLAYSQVEWLKTLNYEDLGLKISGYSPKGIVNPTDYVGDPAPVNIDGVQYTINTSIYWQKAISSTGEPVAQAMKKIDVTVEAQDLNTGAQREYAVLGTLVSREGERDYTDPGYVKVKVYLRSANDPAKNIRVGFGKTQSHSKYTNTDENGEALFGDLKEGSYKVKPTSWKYTSLMIMPNGVENYSDWKVNKEVTVPKWDKNKQDEIQYPEETFIIDLPGYIKIMGMNEYPQEVKDTVIMIKPTGESYIPVEGENPDHMTLVTTVQEIGNMKFWRLWNYEFILRKGSQEFFLEDIDTGQLWDGKFDVSKLNQESLAKVDFKFGIKGGKIIKDIDNPISPVKIIIDFASSIYNYEDIEFEINNTPVPKENYLVTELEGNDHQVSINLDPAIEINDEAIEFKISNNEWIKNTYGMSLAQEKSMITILNP